MPSVKGKKASEAATISDVGSINFFILFIAISQLSNLLGCPDPIPKVVLFEASTIAFDLTYLQILNANFKLLS